jgi:hypothetical protein
MPRAHAQVQAHAQEDAQRALQRSWTVFGLFQTFSWAMIVMECVALAKGHDRECDQQLWKWLCVYMVYSLVLMPTSWYKFYLARRSLQDSFAWKRCENAIRWIGLFGLCWFIVGQVWLYESDTCSTTNPWVYKTSLALIVLTYVLRSLPFIIICLACLCFPCTVMILRYLGEKPKVSHHVKIKMNELPCRTYTSPVSQQAPPEGVSDPNAPACPICTDAFVSGVNVVCTLPCNHEFDDACVKPWLLLNPTCPLCRAPIVAGNSERDDGVEGIV